MRTTQQFITVQPHILEDLFHAPLHVVGIEAQGNLARGNEIGRGESVRLWVRPHGAIHIVCISETYTK